MGNEEMIEHRRGGDESRQQKERSLFPETAEKIFVGEEERREEDDEDEGSDTESDIGVQPEPEEEPGEEEIAEFPGAQSAEEKVERESDDEGGHDGSEADAGEVDRPVGSGQHESGEDADDAPVKELSSEEVDAEYGQRSEKDRPKLEPGDGVAENRDRERLEIDEEPFAAEISRIEKLEIFGFESVEGIDAVGSLIGIEPGGDSFDVIDPRGKGENEDDRKSDPCSDMVGTEGETFAHKRF